MVTGSLVPAQAGPILAHRDDAVEQAVVWWYDGMMVWWYAIQPIHGAVVRLTWYAAAAWCHLSPTLVLLHLVQDSVHSRYASVA